MELKKKSSALAVLATTSMFLAACSGSGSGNSGSASVDNAGSTPSSASEQPQTGGTLTFLLTGPGKTWDQGLDPASAGVSYNILLNAIYGGLFQLGQKGKIIPDLATGYTISDKGKTLTLTLRPDVRFQDGTPFTAQAVAWNIKRDLKTTCTCSPKTSWPPLSSPGITTPNTHTVVLHFTRAYAPLMPSFIGSSVNHIASPTAVKKTSPKEFKKHPVGAGPFRVVHNLVDSELGLKRYDGYWKKGRPYLDGVVFKAVTGDQPAYQALQAGSAQAAPLWGPTEIQQASKNDKLTATHYAATDTLAIQLNTATAPFNDKRAREAIYYATDTQAIASHLLHNTYAVTQSFTGPGGLFYEPKVPGYRTFDLAKAKALVKQLGGMKIDLFTNDQFRNKQINVALQSQWAKAGIKTSIHSYLLPALIKAFGGKWQAALQEPVGARDPGTGGGIAFRLGSHSPFSGVHDPKLDTMMQQAAATLGTSERAKMYAKIAKYISDQAYVPFLVAAAPTVFAAKGVHGPGISSKLPGAAPLPLWDRVWMEQ